jgi:hypothetical protein
MNRPHTVPSRVAVVGLVGLALQALDASLFADIDGSYLQVLVLAQCLVCSAAAAKMLRDNCFESRLAAVAIGVACVAGALLAATSGLPGQPGRGLGALDVACITLGSLVLAAMALDARLRRDQLPATPPYAL